MNLLKTLTLCESRSDLVVPEDKHDVRGLDYKDVICQQVDISEKVMAFCTRDSGQLEKTVLFHKQDVKTMIVERLLETAEVYNSFWVNGDSRSITEVTRLMVSFNTIEEWNSLR
jgi:hypothetical protein